MAQKIEAWKSDTGVQFATEFAAWCADLKHWLVETGRMDQDSAKRLASVIAGDYVRVDGLGKILAGLIGSDGWPVTSVPDDPRPSDCNNRLVEGDQVIPVKCAACARTNPNACPFVPS